MSAHRYGVAASHTIVVAQAAELPSPLAGSCLQEPSAHRTGVETGQPFVIVHEDQSSAQSPLGHRSPLAQVVLTVEVVQESLERQVPSAQRNGFEAGHPLAAGQLE